MNNNVFAFNFIFEDTHEESWTNDSGAEQYAYYIIDAYSSGSGDFTIEWMIDLIRMLSF